MEHNAIEELGLHQRRSFCLAFDIVKQRKGKQTPLPGERGYSEQENRNARWKAAGGQHRRRSMQHECAMLKLGSCGLYSLVSLLSAHSSCAC